MKSQAKIGKVRTTIETLAPFSMTSGAINKLERTIVKDYENLGWGKVKVDVTILENNTD